MLHAVPFRGQNDNSFTGIEVVDSGVDLGRVAVAKQSFAAGDIVLSESPALVLNSDDMLDLICELLTRFLDTPRQTQEALLDLYHGSDDEFANELSQNAALYDQLINILEHPDTHLLSADVVHKSCAK